MKNLKRLLLALAGGLLSLACHADQITYTFSGIASGTLGQNDFAGQALSVVIQGDTANVSASPGLLINSLVTNTVTLGALLTDSITDGGIWVFNNSAAGIVGFSSVGHADLINIGPDGSLSGYGLVTSFGPLVDDSPFIGQFRGVALLGGATLTLDSLQSASFTATLIPEPAPSALLAAGLAGLAGFAFMRRSRRSVNPRAQSGTSGSA